MITINIRGLYSNPEQVILQHTLTNNQKADIIFLGATHLTQDLQLAGLRTLQKSITAQYTRVSEI
jgi:hypothetical protein